MADKNEVVELLQKQLSDAEAREADAKAKEDEAQKRLAEMEAETKARDEDAQKRIAELEAENKALTEAKAAAEAEKAEAEVKAFCDSWAGKGVPPAVLEKVRSVLLSDTHTATGGRPSVIKLSDTEEVPLIKVFGDVFEGMSKVPMGQIGGSDAGTVELSDMDRARSLGKRIAASVNGGDEK